MSHAVTVTRTTTTVTSTSAILLNTGYLKTAPGLLKLTQMLLGCVVVGLVGNYIGYNTAANTYLFVPELFLLLIATTCLITTTCLLTSCLLSISTATIIAKTMFELVYHGIGFALYLASSAYFLAMVSNQYTRIYHYNALIAAGTIAAINTALYFASTFLAFRNYRRG